MTENPPTSDQIRQAIDAGQGADKVSFPDAAAAPLGTDDEASGFPPTREQRSEAAQHATSSRPRSSAWQWIILPLVIVIPCLVVLLVWLTASTA